MAGTKIVTRKLGNWYGRDEEWTNVYYFGDQGVGLSPSEEVATDLVNAVIAAEKLVHLNLVRFLGGVAYKIGAADTAGDTDAISVVELAATGNQGAVTSNVPLIYRECAVDLKFLLGGRRYLRTMLHTWTAHGYDPAGVTPTTTANLAQSIKDFAEKMLNGTWPGGFDRIAPNGDRPTAILYNPYLEHRQYHRYRRRNAGLLG